MKITKSELRNLIKESLLSESTYVDDEGNLRDASSGVIIEPGTPGYNKQTTKRTNVFKDSNVFFKDLQIDAIQRKEFEEKFNKRLETVTNLFLVGGGIAASLMKAPLIAALSIGLLGGATTVRDTFKMFVKMFAKPGGKIKLEQISDHIAETYALDDEILEVLHPDLIDQTIDKYESDIIHPARENDTPSNAIISLADFLKKILKEKSLGKVEIVGN